MNKIGLVINRVSGNAIPERSEKPSIFLLKMRCGGIEVPLVQAVIEMSIKVTRKELNMTGHRFRYELAFLASRNGGNQINHE